MGLLWARLFSRHGDSTVLLYFYGVYSGGEIDKTHVSQPKVISDGYTSSKENTMCEGIRSGLECGEDTRNLRSGLGSLKVNQNLPQGSLS